MILEGRDNFWTKLHIINVTFFSTPAVLQACLSSGLNLEESAAKAWMNWRLYSIFTTQVKCSAKEDSLNHFPYIEECL